MNINKLIGGLDANARARNDASLNDAKNTKKLNDDNQSASDKVNLSSSSKSIQQVEAEIRSMPEVDDAVVDRIRNAIANGEYKIDYDKLAGNMLKFEEDLK